MSWKEVFFKNLRNIIKKSYQIWDNVDSQSREIEEMNFTNPYNDVEINRTNPTRYDKRKDWINLLNEKAEDTDISGRYDQTSLTSGASYRLQKALKSLSNSDQNVPPGFIPTNKGIREPKDFVEDLEYSSYKANRDYDRTISPNSNIPNPNYDFEESRKKWRKIWKNLAGWSDNKLDTFERRYFIETGGK